MVNDGEVICLACRRGLNRTDLNCYACGNTKLDRSKVAAFDISMEMKKDASKHLKDIASALGALPIPKIFIPHHFVWEKGINFRCHHHSNVKDASKHLIVKLNELHFNWGRTCNYGMCGNTIVQDSTGVFTWKYL